MSLYIVYIVCSVYVSRVEIINSVECYCVPGQYYANVLLKCDTHNTLEHSLRAHYVCFNFKKRLASLNVYQNSLTHVL